MVLVVLAACPEEASEGSSGATDWSDWEYTGTTPGEPVNTAADVEAAAPDTLEALIATDGHPVFEAYADAMVGEDDDCPTYVQREPTENWFEAEGRFKCPCHGSNFNKNGDVIAGPAPKPLWRCAVQLADDGQLFIDKGRLENRPGTREQGEFFLPMKA